MANGRTDTLAYKATEYLVEINLCFIVFAYLCSTDISFCHFVSEIHKEHKKEFFLNISCR